MKWYLCLPLVACTSNADIAARYSNALALEYHCIDVGAAAPAALEQVFAREDARLDKRIAEKLAAKDDEGAFVAWLARVDLWGAARSCGSPALALNSIWQRAMEQRARAMKATLVAWDQAQLDGSRTPKQQWQAIEHARQWQENDPDLTARSERLRQKLQRTVRVVGTCQRCKPLVDAVTAAIASRRSPLVKVATAGDATYTLQIGLDATLEATPWRELKRAEATASVTVYNRFNEAEKDSKGNTVKKKVSVRYFVDQETSRAQAQATAVLRKEKSGSEDKQALRDERSDERRRWRWDGDERALPSEAKDPASPVAAPETLLRQIVDEFAGQIAAHVVAKAEEM